MPCSFFPQPGVRVVTASYGAYYSDDFEQQYIEAMGAAGILFVAAAGNGEHAHAAMLPRPAGLLWWQHVPQANPASFPGCTADARDIDQLAPEVRANPASYPLDNIISGKPRSAVHRHCLVSAARGSLVALVAQQQRGASGPFISGSMPAAPSLPLRVGTAVAATRADDQLASFSNYGASTVHLAAPGYQIMSTWKDADDSYALDSGTSMAAPAVAGAAALLWSAKPTATVAEVR